MFSGLRVSKAERKNLDVLSSLLRGVHLNSLALFNSKISKHNRNVLCLFLNVRVFNSISAEVCQPFVLFRLKISKVSSTPLYVCLLSGLYFAKTGRDKNYVSLSLLLRIYLISLDIAISKPQVTRTKLRVCFLFGP